ncbi:endonuclease [Salinibacter ruber]|uniref:endonuclease n=2 Tax=Salinibacter ruber TaxID=146919 RepID=UPI002073B743|nr:endonuclease [Salinibacter ruber]MCS3644666.1 endonuclease I/DNA/RNA endonuclease YhcR with UshA esterase domain [Salinibacter ruber]
MSRAVCSGCFSVCALLLMILGVTPSAAQTPINEARQQGSGTEVTVEGTVTRAYDDFVRLQDGSGDIGASGLVVRQTSGGFYDDVQDGTIAKGTQLEVSGTLSEFNGLLQINEDDLTDYTVQGEGTVPTPKSVTLETLSAGGEAYESVLVNVTDLSVQGASGTFENQSTYTVTDETETFPFRVQDTGETEVGGTAIPEGAFDYTGVVGEFSGDYQLIPVRTSDLQPTLSFAFGRLFVQAEEGGASVSVDVQVLNKDTDGEVSVTAEVAGSSTAENGSDVSGFQSPQTLTFSGTDPSPQTLTLEPVDDAVREGVERLEVVLSSNDGALSSPSRFTLWILDAPAAQAPVVAGDSSGVLLDSLRQRYGDPPTLGYDAARDSLYRTILNEGGTVETIYGGFQASADPEGDATAQLLDQDVNTEHLWPRSLGAEEEPALSNMYILAPAWSEANGYRCNYPYAEINDAETERWILEKTTQSSPPTDGRDGYTESLGNACGNPSDGGRLEPRHSEKGNVARAAFYFAMTYPDRADQLFFEAQRETLLEWHEQDPVDATELRRSFVKATYQGNRINPFIVDSTLAGRAYEQGAPGVQAVSIRRAREEGNGAVTVDGVVTRVGADGPYIQDGSDGLYVYEPEGPFASALGAEIQKGSRLEVTGRLSYFSGLLELTDAPYDGLFEVVGQNESLPRPDTLVLTEIAENGESHESELVRVEDFSIGAEGDDTFQASTEYSVSDATGSLTLYVPEGSALVGDSIPARATFQGVLGQSNGSPGSDEPDTGYRLVGIETSDLEVLRERLPSETTVDVTRSFGDPSTEDSYRLVALPGQVDQALASTLSGEAGVGWQAYWDDGSDQDPFIKFDGGDQFDFRPGRGFWVLSTSDWSVETTIPTVNVQNGETKIPLHDGWNIISNPLPRNVPWSAVQSANEGTLRALQAWDGSSFQETSTFVSAVEGEAFYFLNDQELEQLAIPLSSSEGTTASAANESRTTRTVELVAKRKGRATARVEVGEHPAAVDGKDDQDLVAPPSRFADLSLSVRAPFADAVPERQDQLARDVRSTGTPGQTYTLALRADTTGPVTLRAASLPQSPQVDVSLVDPATGRSHDLRTDGPMTLTAGPDPSRIQLLVGRSSYVASEADDRLPESLTVQAPAPNPFRNQITLKYALPEAQDVTVAVFDLLGRRVRTLVEGRQEAGPHRVSWDGMDASQRQLASGAYFLRVSTDEKQHVEKVVLVR